MAFEDALKVVLRFEGGFVDHPADRGGATNKGITQATYDEYRTKQLLPKRSVKEIEDKEVKEIYRKLYWEAVRGDEIVKIAPKVAVLVFDTAVNSGARRAIIFLQQIVGTEADGILGPKTLAALKKRTEAIGEKKIAAAYLGSRMRFYRNIVEKNPSQAVFLKGWTNRVRRLYVEVVENSVLKSKKEGGEKV